MPVEARFLSWRIGKALRGVQRRVAVSVGQFKGLNVRCRGQLHVYAARSKFLAAHLSTFAGFRGRLQRDLPPDGISPLRG